MIVLDVFLSKHNVLCADDTLFTFPLCLQAFVVFPAGLHALLVGFDVVLSVSEGRVVPVVEFFGYQIGY